MTAVEVPERRKQTLTLEALPEAVAQARRWVAAITCQPLDTEQASKLKLVISEVVTNALRYGTPGGGIDLAVTPKPEFLCVQVTDDGPGLVPRPRALEPEENGGFGLYFVEQL